MAEWKERLTIQGNNETVGDGDVSHRKKSRKQVYLTQ